MEKEGKRCKYMDTIKEQVKLKNVLILVLVFMIGCIVDTILAFQYSYRYIEHLLMK